MSWVHMSSADARTPTTTQPNTETKPDHLLPSTSWAMRAVFDSSSDDESTSSTELWAEPAPYDPSTELSFSPTPKSTSKPLTYSASPPPI